MMMGVMPCPESPTTAKCTSQTLSCRRGRRRNGSAIDPCLRNQARFVAQQAAAVAAAAKQPRQQATQQVLQKVLEQQQQQQQRQEVTAEGASKTHPPAAPGPPSSIGSAPAGVDDVPSVADDADAAGGEAPPAGVEADDSASDAEELVAGVVSLLQASAAEARARQSASAEEDGSHGADAAAGRTVFHARSVPRLSIGDYLRRVRKHQPCSDQCFVLALVYMDRVARRLPNLVATDLTSHRLFLTALMLATRFHDDEEEVHYSNAWFAKLGGLGLAELGTCEARFLEVLDWRLAVTPREYGLYRGRILDAARAALPVEGRMPPGGPDP